LRSAVRGSREAGCTGAKAGEEGHVE